MSTKLGEGKKENGERRKLFENGEKMDHKYPPPPTFWAALLLNKRNGIFVRPPQPFMKRERGPSFAWGFCCVHRQLAACRCKVLFFR